MCNDLELVDVTLVGDGMKEFQAHNMVIEASSYFFKESLWY